MSDIAPEPGFESISAITLTVRDMQVATTFYEALGLRRLYGGAEASFTSYAVGGPSTCSRRNLTRERGAGGA